MASKSFKIWRVLEETVSPDGKLRTITKKEFVGEIDEPKEEIYVTWQELVQRFGEGYYLVEIPPEIHKRYLVPDKQFVRTPAYFEPSPFVRREKNAIIYPDAAALQRAKK
ncbi:MAG TPA: hypothetical protein VGR93_08125 [Candidatus Acidoferrales bacterium]|nr:hypothetical protein [Candidatus Acidoferrales bacterium]